GQSDVRPLGQIVWQAGHVAANTWKRGGPLRRLVGEPTEELDFPRIFHALGVGRSRLADCRILFGRRHLFIVLAGVVREAKRFMVSTRSPIQSASSLCFSSWRRSAFMLSDPGQRRDLLPVRKCRAGTDIASRPVVS